MGSYYVMTNSSYTTLMLGLPDEWVSPFHGTRTTRIIKCLYLVGVLMHQVSPGPENISVGEQIMRRRGLLFEGYFYWISLGALFGIFVLFNIVSTIALTYLGRPS
ncbi:hypothetical protein AAC387_Pa12g1737 [Persea americana]